MCFYFFFFFVSPIACYLLSIYPHKDTNKLQCDLNEVFQHDQIGPLTKTFWKTIGRAFVQMLGHSYVSVSGTLVLLLLAVSFVPVKVSRKARIAIGSLHVTIHLMAAMVLMLLLEIGIETCVRHNLLGTSGTTSIIFFLSLITNIT